MVWTGVKQVKYWLRSSLDEWSLHTILSAIAALICVRSLEQRWCRLIKCGYWYMVIQNIVSPEAWWLLASYCNSETTKSRFESAYESGPHKNGTCKTFLIELPSFYIVKIKKDPHRSSLSIFAIQNSPSWEKQHTTAYLEIHVRIILISKMYVILFVTSVVSLPVLMHQRRH